MSQICGILFSEVLSAPGIHICINTFETMSISQSSLPLGHTRITPFNLFRQPGQPRKSSGSQKRTSERKYGIFERPQLFSSPFSDRIAVYDNVAGAYCAYSLMESINKSGLNQQEAIDWVEGRLVIKQQLSSSNALHVILMIAVSWLAAAFGIWSLIGLIF